MKKRLFLRGIFMKKQVSIIKQEFAETSWGNIENIIKVYENDDRISVQKIISCYKMKLVKHDNELNRLIKMNEIENKAYALGKKCIAGIDEVGRGPLAGPLLTASVILHKDTKIIGINDSKKLSEKKRESLYSEIIENALEFNINMEDNIVIDEINILEATKKSMKKNISNLKNIPDYLIIDAVNLENLKMTTCSIPKADALSISVAAASIIAKVTRDRYMTKIHDKYPQYGFDKNKGYGTKEHIDAIKKYGPCPIHRNTFIKNFVN